MSFQKEKGRSGENESCEYLMEGTNIQAKRVPLSGSLQGEFSDDIDITLPDGAKKKGEVKWRQSVPVSVYKWLKIKIGVGVKKIISTKENEVPPDYLFMRKNKSPWIVCMSIDQFKELVNKIQKKE